MRNGKRFISTHLSSHPHTSKKSQNKYRFSLDEIKGLIGGILKRNNRNKVKAGIGGVMAVGIGCYIFQDDITDFVAKHASTATQKTLDHYDVQQNLKTQVDNLLNYLLENPDTYVQLATLLSNFMAHPEVNDTLKESVRTLTSDEETQDILAQLIDQLSKRKDVQESVETLLANATSDALQDEQFQNQSASTTRSILWKAITLQGYTPRKIDKSSEESVT